MNLKQYCLKLEEYLSSYLQESKMSGYVIGLSGGVDSSLVCALACKAVGPENVLALIIPILSDKSDELDAVEIAKHFGVKYKIINLSDTYNALVNVYNGQDFKKLTKMNLKVRLRMVTLFAHAQENNYLVLGTDNMDERHVGYFTKFGDGAADLFVISKLVKKEVVEASILYGLPERLANRVPTAGLSVGQTDEDELGITYKELDNYLLGEKINSESEKRIKYLNKVAQHKIKEIPEPIPFERD